MNVRLLTWTGVLLAAIATGCTGIGHHHNLPPEPRLLEPGPGVNGPGPGVMMPPAPPMAAMAPMPPVQVLFGQRVGMQVLWDVTGQGMFDSTPLIVPGRQSFMPGGLYRLKLTNIPKLEGVELYPTIEIGQPTPQTTAFLDHSALPVEFTDEDFQQVLAGNLVTKVIYLPDPDFQQVALAGVQELVSTRLDPGMDPIVEADRRGSILAIIRMGNIDPEAPSAALGNVVPAGYGEAIPGMGGAPGMPVPMRPLHPPVGVELPPQIAGVTGPQYGLPITGTPIGLPGPPHIPLGSPAGLQRHSIHNHTYMNLPEPTQHINIHAKQQPGFSYPQPANNVWIHENNVHPSPLFRQPFHDKFHRVPGNSGAAGAACETCP